MKSCKEINRSLAVKKTLNLSSLVQFISRKRFENESRMARERLGSNSVMTRERLGSVVSRFSLASLICLCMLTIGSGNVWGTTYTITFKANSGDGTSITSSTACSTIVSEGASYLTGNCVSPSNAYYNGGSGLKLGVSGSAGSLKMNLAAAGQLTNPTITVRAKLYNSSKSATVAANGATSQAVASSFTNYTFSISGKITYIQLNSTKYIWIESVTVSDEAGGGDCNAIDVTGGSTVILPAGSTSYSGGDWEDAGAPTAYPGSTTEYSIGTGSYCVTLTKVADYSRNSNGLQFQASNGVLLIEDITSNSGVDVEIQISSGSGFSIALTGAETLTGQSSGIKTISTTSTSANLTISKPTSGAGYIKYIKVTPKAASCSASPTVGNAANNGALVYSTSPMTVPVTCPSIGAGSSCEIKDYGFVWKAGGNPSISDNKTPIGTDNHSTAFSGNISGTFTAGTTYYVKAYAINNGDNTTLSTGTYSFTPRSITFNSNGGSSVATILVLSGTAASQPTNPTKDGYTFGGWYTDSGLGTAVNWSSTITSNKTYYAKWNELPKYTVTLKDNDETLTQASAGAAVTLPSRTGCTGYTFAGWTKTWGTAQTEWTTTAPTIIPAGSYTPSANENLYPVYTKTEGGGSTPASITLLPSDFGSSYPTGADGYGTITKGDYSFTYGQFRKNGNGGPSEWCANQLIQARCTLNIGLWNTTPMDITSVVLYKASPTANASTWNVYEGTASAKPTTGAISVSAGSASSITADKYYSSSCHSGELTGATETPLTYTASSGCKYINIAPTNGASYFTKIIINYTVGGGSTTSYISVPACCTDWSTPTVSYSSSLAINASEGVTIGGGTTHGAVTYESSDEDVLTVDADGTIHAVGAGTAHITATWAGDATYCEKSANSNDVTVSGIQVTGTTPVNFGQVYQNAVIADKTIYVTGLGLANAITPSLPAGSPFSFSPASLAANSSNAPLTISASTATLGTYNQTLTLTSGAFSATVTVKMEVIAMPSATFTDALHGVTEDEDGVSLSNYNLVAAQGTAVVFPTLANQTKSAGTCEGEYYIFVGWTEGNNNTDPQDHLVTSHTLANGDAKHYYAVWADASGSATYTKLTTNTFKTAPTKYVLGAEHEGTTYYFSYYDPTEIAYDLDWGTCSSSDAPIQFTLSGTAAELVVKDNLNNYLEAPCTTKAFYISDTETTVELKSDGTIYNNGDGCTSWRLRYNNAGPGLRWYTSNTEDAVYFYEVGAGGTVHYRTSCCANKVDAPVVTATAVTSTSITLTWPSDVKATGWQIEWNGAGGWVTPSGSCTHTVSGLTPNTTYTWRVRATYEDPVCGADVRSGSTTTHQVYHVTYAKGSGTGTCTAEGSTTDATGYEAGATVTLQANEFSLSGHTFAGWTEDDEDITISSNQFTMPDHDVVITASWTAKMDKYFDRMHDQTDELHGGVEETEGTNEGKYYIPKEGCNYSVPTAVDSNTGDACQTSHYKLQGWIAASYMKGYPDHMTGEIGTGNEVHIFPPTGTKTATGATYYAIWAEVTE